MFDANLYPSLPTLVTNNILWEFLYINDIIEAIVEALPMSILQFVNNGLNKSWIEADGSVNWFLVFAFMSSVFSVFIHLTSFVDKLYGENFHSVYKIISYLKKNQKKDKDWTGLAEIFPMKEEVTIETID